MVTIVYMVAGLSSRFGGKIKHFARVGPNNETLIEVSLAQAKRAGLSTIVFIVGEMTEQPFKEKFGTAWQGIPIRYAKQTFDPKERDRPWGTADALIAAKEVISESFVVCNGDDIYGEDALKAAKEFLDTHPNEACCVGYQITNVLPDTGTINRGMIIQDEQGNFKEIKEELNVSKTTIFERGYTTQSLANMNLFGFPQKALPLLEQQLNEFKKTHKGDRKAECFLPVELGILAKEKKLSVQLIPTTDSWFGVTNPNDEALVRSQLQNYYSKK